MLPELGHGLGVVLGAGAALGLMVLLVRLAFRLPAQVRWTHWVRTYAAAWAAVVDPHHPHAARDAQRRRRGAASVAVGLGAVAMHARTCAGVHRVFAQHEGAYGFAEIADVATCVERRASMEALLGVVRAQLAHPVLALDAACAKNQAVLDVVHGLCGATCHYVQLDVETAPPVCSPAWMARAHLPPAERAEVEAEMAKWEAGIRHAS